MVPFLIMRLHCTGPPALNHKLPLLHAAALFRAMISLVNTACLNKAGLGSWNLSLQFFVFTYKCCDLHVKKFPSPITYHPQSTCIPRVSMHVNWNAESWYCGLFYWWIINAERSSVRVSGSLSEHGSYDHLKSVFRSSSSSEQLSAPAEEMGRAGGCVSRRGSLHHRARNRAPQYHEWYKHTSVYTHPKASSESVSY